MNWKDVTTARGEKGQVWAILIGKLRISLHRHILYPPKMWFVTCYALNIEKMQLGEIPVETAKRQALVAVISRIESLYSLRDKIQKLLDK